MIEILVNKNDPLQGDLAVDGKVVRRPPTRAYKEGNYWNINIYGNEKEVKLIAAQRFSDLPQNLGSLTVLVSPFILKNDEFRYRLQIEKDKSEELSVSLLSQFNVSTWKHLWSMQEYTDEIKSIVQRENRFKATLDNRRRGVLNPAFSITMPLEDINSTFEAETLKYGTILRELHQLTEASLIAKLRQESVVMHFDFPDVVKVPCEQYLLYFAQFLKDLGVEADTALTHEAGQVLFTVTPDDKEQALDKIRAALEVYLHLPSSPVGDVGQAEIAVLRLNSELQNIQSKLSLARAEIQMKEAAIQLQKVTIAQMTGEVVIDSLKDVTPKKDKDKEELLGDMVSLIPIKGKGVEIHLPEIFRKLKQLFQKENEE